MIPTTKWLHLYSPGLPTTEATPGLHGRIPQPGTGCIIWERNRFRDDGTTLWFCGGAGETRGSRSFLASTPGYGDGIPLGFGRSLILNANWNYTLALFRLLSLLCAFLPSPLPGDARTGDKPGTAPR